MYFKYSLEILFDCMKFLEALLPTGMLDLSKLAKGFEMIEYGGLHVTHKFMGKLR